MTRVAVFPGSFDPFTCGHEDIVRQALPLFDQIVIGIGVSSSKTPLMRPEDRRLVIDKLFAKDPRVTVEFFEGLTVNFAEKMQAKWILRGLRTEADFSYEMPMAETNRKLNSEVQTVFLPSAAKHTYVSSSLVKELFRHKGAIDGFVPDTVADWLKTNVDI